MWRRISATFVIGTILLAACASAASPGIASPPSSPPTPAVDLIQAVLSSPSIERAYGSWPVLKPFPHQTARATCQLPQWQPASAGTSDFTSVSRSCETSMRWDGSGWKVRFTQTWDAAQFHLAGEPGAGQLHHSWEFSLDTSGQIQSWSHEGNYPPQFVHTPFSER
ncbi:hypothetical protein [Kouleothrix sp.]|uniref:hypothetical protein n=1 Tax=Kouleothrix sp. TaxID=2779161 RepID=UPI00391DEF3C